MVFGSRNQHTENSPGTGGKCFARDKESLHRFGSYFPRSTQGRFAVRVGRRNQTPGAAISTTVIWNRGIDGLFSRHGCLPWRELVGHRRPYNIIASTQIVLILLAIGYLPEGSRSMTQGGSGHLTHWRRINRGGPKSAVLDQAIGPLTGEVKYE